MVRLIGRNNPDEVTQYWQFWATQINDWISQGLQPWIFTHAPDDRAAPQLAYLFDSNIRLLRESLQALPRLNTAEGAKKTGENNMKQLELF
jgi:uncharacterized protein YecE (DUF72 family)